MDLTQLLLLVRLPFTFTAAWARMAVTSEDSFSILSECFLRLMAYAAVQQAVFPNVILYTHKLSSPS